MTDAAEATEYQWMDDFTPFSVCLINRKGGVGKSSTCYHAGATFARLGKRVLLVDMDPQASLSDNLVGQNYQRDGNSHTVASLFDERQFVRPRDVIYETAFPNLFIAPAGGVALNHFDRIRPDEPDYRRLQPVLRRFVESVKDEFDVIMVDCRPTLNFISWAALLACDYVMVPLQPEDFGSRGIPDVQEVIEQARSEQNRKLKVMGYLLTFVQPRLTVHVAVEGALRQVLGDAVFNTRVPLLGAYKEAVAAGYPISHYKATPAQMKKPYKPRNAAAKVMVELAREMVERTRPGRPAASPAPDAAELAAEGVHA